MVYDQIPNIDNYGINRIGEIYSYKHKKVLKTVNHRDGYKVIRVQQNGIQKTYCVHRLLALTYIPNPQNKRCVNHIDGNKSNNDLLNLEWVTDQENTIHAYKNGLMKGSPKLKLVCSKCGTKFSRKPSNIREGIYCSHSCYSNDLKNKVRGVQKNCARCGTQIYRMPSRIKAINYCSKKCVAHARHGT